MCSCWDRWGSRPLFEVPAKEAIASSGLSTPLCKIFRTESHWAPLLLVFLFKSCWSLKLSGSTEQQHLTKDTNFQTFTNSPPYNNRGNTPSDDLFGNEEFTEVDFWLRRGKQTEWNYLPFNISNLISLLWFPLHCCWQITSNWICLLSWHTVKAGLILLPIPGCQSFPALILSYGRERIPDNYGTCINWLEGARE